MYTKHAEFKAGVVILLAIAGLLALVYFAGGEEPIWGSWRAASITVWTRFSGASRPANTTRFRSPSSCRSGSGSERRRPHQQPAAAAAQLTP